MARPRRDSSRPEVRLRIIDAFWELLADHEISAVTVGEIVKLAECNRGSFYYHYADVPDLVEAALENELTGDGNIPGRLFILVTGAGSISEVLPAQGESMRRLSLAMERGGYELVNERVVAYIEEVWTAVLCDEGESLTAESRFIITYATGALLNVFRCYGDDIESASAVEGMFLAEAGGVAVRNLCSAQGRTIEDVLERLRAMRGFRRMAPARRPRGK